MRLRRKKKDGQSMIEFATLVVFILAAFLVFQKYLVRGFSGRWKQVGESLGQGRIYDPDKTIECAANRFFTTSSVVWYNAVCFDQNCKGACLLGTKTAADCDACIGSCQTPFCN
jgi:Flp pilus assembly pilin Flp